MLRAAERLERVRVPAIRTRRPTRETRQLSVPSPSLPRVGNETVTQPPGAEPHEAALPGAQAQETALPADALPAAALPAAAPAERGGTGAPRSASLSPSRAGDFLTCPLLYRFRVIDRLPEPPSPAAARGTLVHAVLERLFDEPAAHRTPQTAQAMLAPQWERLITEVPELAGLFDDDEQRSAWLAEARDMLDRYFTLEDPTRLEPRHREHAVEAILESGLLLRGYIDRLDVAAGGEIRIVDYKTGTAPKEEYEARALFQMKFYAVVLWLTQQRVPKLLQLMYLGNGEIVRYAPDESDLRATVRKIDALWLAIERARRSGDWRPRPGRLCAWCAHQAICPAFGGTPPPLPQPAEETTEDAAQAEPLQAAAPGATAQAQPSQAQPSPAQPAQAQPAQADAEQVPSQAETPVTAGVTAGSEVPAQPGPPAAADAGRLVP
jgi:putative RecB family exonuclease